MVQADSPAAAPHVAKPARRECPEYSLGLSPICTVRCFTIVATAADESGPANILLDLSTRRNSGPSVILATCSQASRAATGQSGPPTRGMAMCRPVPCWSVLLLGRVISTPCSRGLIQSQLKYPLTASTPIPIFGFNRGEAWRGSQQVQPNDLSVYLSALRACRGDSSEQA